MGTRSHHGCARCKRRRQKCDELRPTCTRCSQAGTSCDYLVTLKWDGRVPRIDGCSRKVRRKPPAPLTALEPHDRSHRPSATLELDLLKLSTPAGGLESWPATDRFLMHHFINHTSHIIAHRHMRDQTCRDLVPLANERPALRYAVMAMSAIHRMALLEGIPQHFSPDVSVSQLLTRSLQYLQHDLKTPDDSVLQTIKTLCICEIYSGRADSAWRTHVSGAAAILRARSPDQKLINQWYQSMEALTALTNHGPLSKNEIHPIVVQETILDMYTGYTPDLNIAFRQIGLLTRKNHTTDVVKALEDAVWEMIYRDEQELRFPPDVQLHQDEVRQFKACNTVYQHCALIHIFRRLHGYDSQSAEVQYCVRKILKTLCGIMPMNALSPWALLTTPIFTAGSSLMCPVGIRDGSESPSGPPSEPPPNPAALAYIQRSLDRLTTYRCEAFGDDRELVKSLLRDLYSTLRIRNVLRAAEILEHQWSRDGQYQQQSEIENLDFIPY